MARTAFLIFILVFGSQGTDAAAQHQHHDPARHSQPYSGLEKRDVKGLSAQEMDDLQVGRGMGLALAAELNSYPGPRHVLDLEDALELTEQQRDEIGALFERMTNEAIHAGKKVIAVEKRLEALFSSGKADEPALDHVLNQITEARTELRRTHLVYHLRTKAVLTPEQVARYDRLRGYAGNGEQK
ncbi:MAG: Spy/CpxP family protein refolding chaperone [Rhodomicrobiaceae bacterium]